MEMNKDKEIEKASSIVFPIFLKAVKEETPDSIIYEKIKKWGEVTLQILNEVYPPDIFTGVSNETAPKDRYFIRYPCKNIWWVNFI
jgi:hypothetical protein